MAATVIQFPKKIKPRSVKSIDLYYCWDRRLNNPLLNSLYKSEVCYVERWFLQIIHILNTDDLSHPLYQVIMSKNDPTLDILLEVTGKDLTVHRYMEHMSTMYVGSPNTKKLERWLSKWNSLHLYRARLSNM